MPGANLAEIYFIIAMMIVILVVCVAAVFFFIRQYRSEMREKARRESRLRPDSKVEK